MRFIFFFFFIVSGHLAQAGDKVVFFSASRTAPEIVPGDYESFKKNAANLRRVFTEIGSSAEILEIEIDQLSEISTKLKGRLSSEDRVVGVIFAGHGSVEALYIHNKAFYKGADLAASLHAALLPFASGERLAVYLAACSCGNENGTASNLQTRFLEKFRELEGPRAHWSEVQVIAHRHFSDSTARSTLREPSAFNVSVYKTSLPRLFYSFSVFVLKTFGRNAMSLITPMTLLGGMAISGMSFADGSSASGLLWATGSIVTTASLVVFEHVGNSWVSRKTLRDGEIFRDPDSTVFGGFQAFFGGRSALRCESLFAPAR